VTRTKRPSLASCINIKNDKLATQRVSERESDRTALKKNKYIQKKNAKGRRTRLVCHTKMSPRGEILARQKCKHQQQPKHKHTQNKHH